MTEQEWRKRPDETREQYIARRAAEAPPLTPERREQLAAILRPAAEPREPRTAA